MNPILIIVLLLSPLLIGGIIAALNSESVNNTTEKTESWIRNKQLLVAQKKSWFYRYLVNPFLFILVKFSDWTDNFTHQGLKNGVRVASALYLTCLTILLIMGIIYLAIMVALVVAAIIIGGAVLYFILKIVFGWDNSSGRSSGSSDAEDREVLSGVGIRGKNVYSGSSWFTEELKGRVDEEGNIYRGTSWLTSEKIGRIDKDGNIYKGTSFLDETKIGRIDKDGHIYKGSSWFTEESFGRIDKDGDIQEGTTWLDEKKTGRTGN